MNKLITLFFMGTMLLGCVSRSLVSVSDHPTKPLTRIEMGKSNDYLFWSTYEHIFYSCSDSGENLSCKRLCGGDTDVACPDVSLR